MLMRSPVGWCSVTPPSTPGDHEVADPDVGEGAADHDAVVAAAGAVGVEVLGGDAALDQQLAGRGRGLDAAGRADVVGGDAVAEDRQRAGVGDRLRRGRVDAELLEVGRLLDVRRAVVPRIDLAGARGDLGPQRAERAGIAVDLAVGLGVGGAGQQLADLLAGRPHVAQVHRLAGVVGAERVAGRGRCRRGRRARRRRPAAGSSGSWRGSPDGCAPRSCGCPRARWRRRRCGPGSRPPAAGRAGPSCRCRWCSRSRRSGTRACRGRAAGRSPAGTR